MFRLKINSQKHGVMTRDFESEIDLNSFITEKGDHYGIVGSTVFYEVFDISEEEKNKKDKADKKDKDRKNRVKDLKAIDFKNINNVADLKPILKAIIDEILKDDE